MQANVNCGHIRRAINYHTTAAHAETVSASTYLALCFLKADLTTPLTVDEPTVSRTEEGSEPLEQVLLGVVSSEHVRMEVGKCVPQMLLLSRELARYRSIV